MPSLVLIEKAFLSSLDAIGQTWGSLLFWFATVCLGAAWVWFRDGWSKFRDHIIKKILWTATIVLLAFSPVFFWHLGYEIKTEEVSASPAPVVAKYREPKDALRIRAIRLADELDVFTNERWSKRPKGEGEDTKKYDDETVGLYTGLYKSKTVGILQELRAKGLDVGLLDAYGAAQTRALQQPETKELRYIAHYLDERGNVVQIPK
jgi:hypothetical protein